MAGFESVLDDGSALVGIMRQWYPLIIRYAYLDAARLGVSVEWQPDDTEVLALLEDLASKIVNVADTTRDVVRRVVAEGLERGDSPATIGQTLRARGVTDSVYRGKMIARTETGTAYNRSSVAAYRAGGITHVQVLDGDDDEPCASANGSIWTLAEAEQNPLGHPNCTRAFMPIVEVDA